MNDNSPEAKPQAQESKGKISRREVLKNLGLLGTGIVAAKVPTLLPTENPGKNNSPESQEAQPLKIYKSGEVIENPVTTIKIDGWRILFDRVKMENYRANSISRQPEFRLINPYKEQPVVTPTGGYGTSDVDQHGKRVPGLGAFVQIQTHPLANDQLIFLQFSEEEKGQIVRSEIYPIDLENFTYKAQKMERTVVFSEEPLNETRLRNIYELRKLSGKFNFPSPPDILIFKSTDKENRGGEYSYIDDSIYLPSILFTEPDFENEGTFSLWHELSHGIYQNAINERRDQRIVSKLFDAYKNLIEAAGYKIPMPSYSLFGVPKQVAENPYFRIFSESSYVPSKRPVGVEYGHPYSDDTELFASGLTILRFFPNEFTERFKSLDQNQQLVVGNAAACIIDVLEKINPEEEALMELLPQYRQLKTLLKI